MANSPALPRFNGRITRRLIIMTEKNTIAFDTSIEKRKFQFTTCQSNSTSDKKIRDGNANVPTNVLRPLVSEFDMILNSPAR